MPTDGEQPLPALKVSAAAFNEVAGMDKLSRMPEWRRFFTPEMNRLNTAFVRYARDSLTRRWIAALPPKASIWLMDTLFVPGRMQHYLFRKRFIEECVRDTITTTGAWQVINLGAGFDTLTLRIATEYPVIRFFEVDFPHTQAVKRKALEQAHYAVPLNCGFIPADLTHDNLDKVLLSNPYGIEARQPVMIIIEEALMYLSEAEVISLLDMLGETFTSTITIVFGVSARSVAGGNWSQRLIHRALRKGNEGATWSLASGGMEEFVAKLGYALKMSLPYKELQRLYRPERDVRNVPEEGENYYLIVKNEPAGEARQKEAITARA